ncbi:hypothetical protein F5J12DRAFT_786006 [Pisolithus orientalis]|uniref:uncharacterized protein n=1 Tax=Pisolithus orientalis TaxID=936130 RepID=UPI0022247AEE|nr:uncharacterized protein F5J12DRAFT_786006 [Pisolithus orientalis]KAI5993125.1 hypothetical protein F5J12DRAFT_786006 [Pisolithus orientalis]
MSTKQSHQVHFHRQANVRPIEPRQSSSHVKQSKNLEETLVQLHELQEPTPPQIVSSGRADMAGSNMDIVANSCESLLDQFLQEREPTALAEGGIVAIIDPHDNLMNQFLNEQEPTAPPADGMNVDLLKQLLNAQKPSALPVMHKKLNKMDGSSAPAQDVTMQDMREPTPPPLVSNVPIKSFDLAVDEDNGTNCLTFGMPEQSEMRDLFKEICNSALPSTQQSLQMEQWGLAPVPCCDQVSCYCRVTTPSDTPFNPTLSRHLVQAANAIARELGTAARDHQSHPSSQSVVEMGILYLACWIEVASVHLKQTANIAGWLTHWFAKPSNGLADPNSGFAFPWWLYHSEEYTVDSQRLQGKGLFSVAWDFFKLMMAQGLWPLPEVPITDCLNGHIEEQVNYCIENIWKYANVVNGQG